MDKIKSEPTKYKKSKTTGSMKEKKYTPYITEEGKKMVPSFNTSGQFLGYNEKKQTTNKKRNLDPELVPHRDKAKRSPIHPDELRPEQTEGGRATHGYGKAYLKGGRVK